MSFPHFGEAKRSVVRVAAGLACAAGAVVVSGTPAAGMLWAAALTIACLGYGALIDRLARRRWSTGITVVSGMAVLLGISTVLAQVGLLIRPIQIAAVFVGIALCVLPDAHGSEPKPPTSVRLYVVAAAVFAIGVELIASRVSFADGFNHVLFVKRLWDTGKLGLVHHQVGLQVVGESYMSLMSGARAAGVFELGGCVALLVFLLSTEIGAGAAPIAQPLMFLLTVPVVLWPGMSEQWSGAVLLVATFVSLQRAREANVCAAHTCVLALALVLLRHEYVIVAIPFIALAVKPTWSRRALAIGVAVWFIALIPYELALAVPVARAVLNAALLALALALVPACRRVIGPGRDPDALGALVFATVMYGLALLVDAIRPAQHSEAGVVTICFGAAVCLLWLLARERDARAIHLGAATAALTLLVAYTIFGPGFEGGRYSANQRLIRATVALRQTLVFGGPHDLDAAVAALQAYVPRGARIGFWGESAGQLDFRRNPVTNLTWSGKRGESMVPMTASAVRHVDYVLLENLEPSTAPDQWNPRSDPAADVGAILELTATSDGAFLFRVRR